MQNISLVTYIIDLEFSNLSLSNMSLNQIFSKNNLLIKAFLSQLSLNFLNATNCFPGVFEIKNSSFILNNSLISNIFPRSDFVGFYSSIYVTFTALTFEIDQTQFVNLMNGDKGSVNN